VDGIQIDFDTLSSTTGGHKEACTLTWTALLADGTRALAQEGQWREAAEHAMAHRGTGARLLDGRQAAILALLADGQASKAAQMVEQSTVTEPWERAVQAMLRVLCQRSAGHDPTPGIATMIAAACALAKARDPATAVTRTRIGLTALDLASDSDTTQVRALFSALVASGSGDAYMARDLLASRQMSKSLTSAQRLGLQGLVHACALGAGTIPAHLRDLLTAVVGKVEVTLTRTISTWQESVCQ
jgi:hypothetical protein